MIVDNFWLLPIELRVLILYGVVALTYTFLKETIYNKCQDKNQKNQK